MVGKTKKNRRLNGWRVLLLVMLAGVVYLLSLIVRIFLGGQQDDLVGLTVKSARADVIIVLGARQNNGRPSGVLEGRLEHAVALFKKGYASHILFTGGKQSGDNYTEAGTGRRYAVEHGAPNSVILEEPNGKTTMQSLQACKVIMEQQHLKSAILISDPFHAFRLRRMINDLGMEAVVSPTPSSRVRSLTMQLRFIFNELLKYSLYRFFGV